MFSDFAHYGMLLQRQRHTTRKLPVQRQRHQRLL